MGEIDLIPAVYRARQQLRSRLRQMMLISAVLVSVVLVAVVVLRQQNAGLQESLRKLQYAKAISTQQRDNFTELNQRKGDLTQQYELLSGLRSGAAAVEMLRTVDRAMSGSDVWFTDWRFRRAGTVADVPAEHAQLTGNYFVVVSRTQPAAKPEVWMIETHMNINGEAVDHAALSSFVSRLVDQPEIQSVRVLRTQTFLREQRPMIRFGLEVVVAWPQQEASA